MGRNWHSGLNTGAKNFSPEGSDVMAEEKSKKLEKLYIVAVNSAQSPQPKRALLGSKCPKCDSKLRKEAVKEMIFSGEGGTEFAKKVVSDAGFPPSLYELSIEHFTCPKCGYDYAKASVSKPREE